MITTAFYDPASGESKRHDYKAIVVGTMLKGIYYVRYAYIRQEVTANDVVEELYRIDTIFPGVIQGFEKNGFQVLYKDLLKNKAEKKGYPISIHGITSVSNKYARIESLAGFIEDGSIQFCKDMTGYVADIGVLVEQLLDFPNGAHDDGPDALYYAFMMAKDKAMRGAYASAKKTPGEQPAAKRNATQPKRDARKYRYGATSRFARSFR